jgi:hypothetical protein
MALNLAVEICERLKYGFRHVITVYFNPLQNLLTSHKPKIKPLVMENSSERMLD